jgi:four helix bundle protein
MTSQIQFILKNKEVNPTRDQLYRAASSILLNIAEGAGKSSWREKKNFYTIARGSVQECVAIIQLLKVEDKIDDVKYTIIYSYLVEMSKMLSGLIRSIAQKV